MNIKLAVALGLLGAGLVPASLVEAETITSGARLTPEVEAQIYAAKAKKSMGNAGGAVELWLPLAQAGVTEAEYEIGLALISGEGICQSPEAAAEWLTVAAGKGYAPAQGALGELYLYTEPFSNAPDHRATAEAWFLKAAEQGDVDAQLELGNFYGSSIGGQPTPEQYAQSANWYAKAAAQGSARAMSDLGRLYQWGKGVKKDYVQAAVWYRKAAEADNPAGQAGLAGMYEEGLGMPANPQQAYKWYRLAGSSRHGGSSSNARDSERVRMSLTPAQIEIADADVRKFRTAHPGQDWNGVIPVPPVPRARQTCAP